ncbi:MAG: hypothetical protein AAGD25_19385 [Cyanobacteria bacterium P01_F01_bin.150]
MTIDRREMPKKFSITVPDEIEADLQQWADFEGRPKANLAAFIVEMAVKSRYPDKYPPLQVPGTVINQPKAI